MIQHDQEVEVLEVPLIFMVGTDQVGLQKMCDEGEVDHIPELVADGAFEQLEGGTVEFF